ncbi:MAG: alanine--tRNA ligase [Fibrobacterales bacterium]
MAQLPKTAQEIRQSFLDFFKSKEHEFVRSAPVAPQDDPTLMFTNAGMNQYKSIFLGDNPKGLKRAVNSQKCIRVSGKHNDLEEVGKDTYHHTLFEMLGNWSFGDYYKKEAIQWAWEYLTEVLKLEKKRIFVSVFETDDEAAELWASETDIDPNRIMRFGKEDNFWEMGETGPCGPCSEIHYDKGDISTQDQYCRDKILGVNGENDRFIEIWNLVFIQSQRLSDGSLEPLKSTHVDTGMGFERLCAILQGVHSNYDTDVFTPLITAIAQESGVAYVDDMSGMPHRVIADHLRAVSFAIADGVMPSNEGRGYVIRRILRRACKYARNLGARKPFMTKLVPSLVSIMGDAFPEISERQDFIMQVIKSEEESFIKTLGTGLERFEKIVAELGEEKVIPGEKIFTLYDTYGFPMDLSRVLAEEKGLEVDEAGFTTAMNIQKERARSAQKEGVNLNTNEGWEVLISESEFTFHGYQSEKIETQVTKYQQVGDEIYIMLTDSPFYAESGGQVGEEGRIYNDDIALHIFDVTKINNNWVHRAKVVHGDLSRSAMEKAFVAESDHLKRSDTKRNHTATHLLQAALREVLGTHVEQQGSRVAPDSLRFDFSHFSAVSTEEIEKIEDLVNKKILENINVTCNVMNVDEAKADGAMALFGEKYDDDVRVINISTFSKELCGGFHTSNTGEIGLFKIIFETSVASGVRRIEAVTGRKAAKAAAQNAHIVDELKSMIKCKSETVVARVSDLMASNRSLEKEIQTLKQQVAAQASAGLVDAAEEVNGINLLIKKLEDGADVASTVEAVADRLKNGVAVLASKKDSESGSLAVVVSKDLVKKVKAGDLVKKIAEIAGGRGGGRPDRAQAGTKTPEKLDAALAQAKEIVLAAL